MKTNNNKKKIKITFVLVGLTIAILLTSAGSAISDTWTRKADMPASLKYKTWNTYRVRAAINLSPNEQT